METKPELGTYKEAKSFKENYLNSVTEWKNVDKFQVSFIIIIIIIIIINYYYNYNNNHN